MRLRLSALIAATCLAQSLRAQTSQDTTRLDEIVVSASRIQSATGLRGVAADVIDAEELRSRGLERLEQALGLVPGTGLARTGAPGGVSSAFMRGTNSNHTLLLIDGVRVSDANLPPGSLLGGFELSPSDRVEVVRGAQSTLFGGAAIGGVVAVDRDREARGRGITGSLTAGTFATYRGRMGGRWTSGSWDVAADASVVDAANQRPFNPYDQRTQHVQISHTSDRLAVGASFRGLQQSYTSPGDIRTTNTTPVGETEFDHYLATMSADYRFTARWSSRLVTGWQHYSLRGTSQWNGGDEFVSGLSARRWVADWQHRVAASSLVSLAFGVNAEWTAVDDGADDRDERLRAGYFELSAQPTAALGLNAGVRLDDYSTFRSAATGRVSLAWLASESLKLRGSLGTGFLPPSLSDRYGSAFQNPNPSIRPERSTGWDLGVDWYVPGARATIGMTLFETRLRDLIGYEAAPYPDLGRSVNVSRARTRGIEVSGRVISNPVSLRIGYTYLSARSLDEADPELRRLIRRPAHTLSADLLWTVSRRIDLGMGGLAGLDREDTDFNQFPFARVDPGDYLDARLHGRVQVGGGLAATAVLENLFNRLYEEVYGFPVLGRRITVGVSVDR